MKHLFTMTCVAIAGCSAEPHRPNTIGGVAVSFEQPKVTVVRDRLYVNGFDEGSIEPGDKVVVSYCGVSVNGEARTPSP